MGTLVCFHAHPDDESIGTGGTIVRAKEAGHRVVLVVATRGERGEVQPGVLRAGEELWERRLAETFASAEVLGIDRVEFLGYVDSGMMGDPGNDAPYSFWRADRQQAAARLGAILEEESAEVLTIYDDYGIYGHPDHLAVHQVGLLAARRVGTPRVLEATVNRTLIEEALRAGAMGSEEELAEIDADPNFGKHASVITHAVDVSDYVGHKRRSMAAHASQIGPDSWFLSMDDATFNAAFGIEWYIESGGVRAAGDPFTDWVF